jgi:hypothetical protein
MSRATRTTLQRVFPYIVGIALLIIMGLTWSYQCFSDANFNPLNGDYQTYNTTRRMFAGQVPFRDFTSYLGVGVNYLMFFATALFGNTLTGSKMGTLFIVHILMSGLFFVVLYLKLQKAKLSLIVTIVIVTFITFTNILNQLPEIADSLRIPDAMYGGNSLRPLRIALPTIAVAAMLLLTRLPTNKVLLNNKIWAAVINYRFFIIAGTITALSRFWSNDVGLAFIVSFVGSIAIVHFQPSKEFLYKLIAGAFAFIITYIVGGELLTMGALGRWAKYNFIIGGGVVTFQKWYFGSGDWGHIYTIDGLISIFTQQSWQAWVVLLYSILHLLKSRASTTLCKPQSINQLYISTIGLTIYLSDIVYSFGSGGSAYYFQHNVFIIAVI